MLVDEKVEVGWSPRNKKYYESLGYTWTGQGSKFKVKSNEVLKTDNTNKINVLCDECGEKYLTTMYYKAKREETGKPDLCSSCSKKGSRNSQYGKDRSELMKYAKSFQKENPMKGKKHSSESKKKMSKIRTEKMLTGEIIPTSNNRGKKHWYHSTKMNEDFYAESNLELYRMIQLDKDDNVKSWIKQRHGIKIPYVVDRDVHNYIPDFFIVMNDGTIIIEETKGYVKQEDLIKKQFAEQYCKENNMTYIFTVQKEIEKEYKKFLKELGGN